MMRKDYLYIAFLGISVLAFVIAEALKPEEVDFTPDYTRSKTLPLATRILYEEMDILFPDQTVNLNEASVYLSDENSSRIRNRIFINSAFSFDELESRALLNQARSGDHIFISGRLGGTLADSLDLEFSYFYALFDSTYQKDHANVFIQSPVTGTDSLWKYERSRTYHYISDLDSNNTTILGSWDNERPNFVRISIGKGTIMVHTNPDLLTNYYMRKPENATYAFSVISHLPVQPTVWDAYYKDGRKASGTPLYVILETPYLRQAWQLSLVLLLLFMVIRARRRQRAIPIIDPPVNSTIKFTKTIASLYMEQHDVEDVIRKRLRYFKEYVSSHMNLELNEWSDALLEDLSQRSGVSQELTGQLFAAIQEVEQMTKPGDNQLKTISNLLDTFYKQSER